jgi:hypothetical protein
MVTMPWQTKRRLRRDVEALRIELDRAREATKKAERRIDDLKLVIRDTAEQRDLAETHKTNLAAQLDIAHQGLDHAKKVMAELAGVDLVKRGEQ